MNQKNLAVVIFLLMISTTCFAKNNSKFIITTSFYPLYFVTEQIVGDKATINNLVGSNDPHNFKIAPKQLATLYKSDFVIYLNSTYFEPFLKKTIVQLKKNKIKTVEIISKTSFSKFSYNHNLDPHIWLDPILMIEIIDLLTTQFTELDHANQAFYEANSSKLKQQFIKLHNDYKLTLTSCKKKEVIITHNFIGYLSNRYNFKVHSIAGLSTLDKPSAKKLVALKKLVTKKNIKYILLELNDNLTRFAEILVVENNLKKLYLNSLSHNKKDQDFFEEMATNLFNLKKALSCF